MKKIAIFASGNGGNFEALAAACQSGEIRAEAALLVCDRPGAYVVERARRLGVPALVLDPKSFPSKADYERKVRERLEADGIDLVCLAGYMRILTPVLLEACGGRIINIHPSLLPSFKGAHGIRDAFEYGVKVFGVSIHWVTAELDGGRIIAQQAFPYEGRDLDELEARVHAIEHPLYVATVAKLVNEL